MTYDITTTDIEYLRHGDQPLLARVIAPQGPGPFRCVVELHGGAWSQFDRTRGKSVHEALARSGVVVVALDFRQGREGAYPLSVADVNYGVRWVKAHSRDLRISPEAVGLSGNSSGAHLAMLVAMRPRDARYAQLDGPAVAGFDASARCVVMLWPVINPLGRYRYAQRRAQEPSPPEWAGRLIGFHDTYWTSEANMAEGNPMLILERGERVELPPCLWIQSTNDEVHDYRDIESAFPGPEADRFVAAYRKAGGEIELSRYDAPMMFTTAHPTLPASVAALDVLCRFVHRHIPDPRAGQSGARA